jgi:hypothetical protein
MSPLLALSGQINCARVCPLLDGGLNGSTQHFIFEGKDGAGESLESVSDEKAARRYRRMIVPAGTYTASVTACGHGRMMIHVDDASDPHVDMYGLYFGGTGNSGSGTGNFIRSKP